MNNRSDKAELAKAPHVAICIATYRRPDGLRALIKSLDAMTFEKFQPYVTLVIADNCPESPASHTLGDISMLSRWPTIYVMEPDRGIVSARNKTLEEAPKAADLIAFLDDDETVSPGWLEAMLLTKNNTGATVVYGPVFPRFEKSPPCWIEDLQVFQTGPFPEGKQLVFAATNNALVCAKFLRRNALRFDLGFNNSGGEDQELFNRLQGAGGVIRASTHAVVYDTVPVGRMTLNWILRRAYRTGNTLGRIANLRKQGRVRRLAKGIGLIAKGLLLTLGILLLSKPRFFKGLMDICRGYGMLTGLMNIHFAEYSLAAVLRDRKVEN